MKKLYKASNGIMVDGVCAGFAKYFNFDVSLVRIAALIFAFTGSSVLVYIICAIIMPRESKDVGFNPEDKNKTKNENSDAKDYRDFDGNDSQN